MIHKLYTFIYCKLLYHMPINFICTYLKRFSKLIPFIKDSYHQLLKIGLCIWKKINQNYFFYIINKFIVPYYLLWCRIHKVRYEFAEYGQLAKSYRKITTGIYIHYVHHLCIILGIIISCIITQKLNYIY